MSGRRLIMAEADWRLGRPGQKTQHSGDTGSIHSPTNEGPWQRLQARETRLARESGAAIYVLTGPLFEQLMRPLPRADERHMVPSG